MQTILQSVFLQALAYALLKSIWQMGLLWLATIFILRVLKLSSAQKFKIAFVAQLCGFVLFISTLFNGYVHEQTFHLLNAANNNYINNTVSVLQYAMPFIAVAYLIFLLRHIIKLLFNYSATQKLRTHHLSKMPAAIRVFLDELTVLFSLHKKVKIYISETIRCPLTIGFFKPLILIPLAAVNHLTKEQMEAVILHELAHIKRADYIFYLLQCFIEKIFFFNVFSNLINNIIERERENACDDWVIQFKYNSFHYAEALLKLGKLQTSSALAMAASGKKEHVLLHRIKRLVHSSEKNYSYEYTAWRFSFLTLIISLGLMISFSSKTASLVAHPNVAQNIVSVTENNNQKTLETPELLVADAAQNNQLKNQQKKYSKNNTQKLKKINVSKNTLKKTEPVIVYSDIKNINPDYFVSVNQTLDSAEEPSYSDASNKQLVLNEDAYKKALSYRNFKQLETMLTLTGDSITVTEDPATINNYKKLITIETTDKNGNKHIYKVVVELYQ